ncbi:protein DpdG [Sinomonas terrae]|uniref:ATP-dependent helicase n=1 Tax=Sinomonas terrae TaxID=2908838 RepID=A0ABS9U269_9MICC|nr:protein DpdG [Sinomonas terrae]MCH6470685.1 hypothetical protein [Sinomonas terrae]
MALLNPRPVLALPTTMWLTFRVIAEFGPIPESEMFALISPPAIRVRDGASEPPPTSAASEAYRVLRELGITETDEQGRLRLATAGPSSYADFCSLLRNVVLSRPISEPPLDESGANDLLRGLAWLLTTDPMGEPWSQSRSEQEQVPAGGTPVFRNSSVLWTGFRYWAEAMGFAEIAATGTGPGSHLLPNPTRALRDFVVSTYRPGDDIPISRLVSDFRLAAPVVPGGAVSRALGYEHDADEIDRATTYALESGRARGWLTLERRADAADTMRLAGLDHRGTVRVISDVVVGEVEDV